MNEISLTVTKLTNSIRFRHPCKDCGYEHAAFGIGVSLVDVIIHKAQTGVFRKDLLGEWTCGPAGCVNKAAI